MRVIAKRALRELWERHPDAQVPLVAWHEDAEASAWARPADIKSRYPAASFLAGNRVVLNIGGNRCRLMTRINCAYGIVYVRFVGTHAAYDRIDAETI